MSNHLAIATVTATLRDLLLTAMHDVVPGDLQVRTGRPESSSAPFVGANLYLYQVAPNAALRNSDQPMRRSDGSLMQRPRVALELSYLITFYGDESKLEPQRLMGSVIAMMYTNPVLTPPQIRATIDSAANRYLANSDLDQQIESVKFTPLYLSLEEISKIWTVFFQVTHALSLAWQGSVVIIDSFSMPTKALPVRTVLGRAIPSGRPVIRNIQPRTLDYSPSASITISVDGVNADSRVLIGGLAVVPQLTANDVLEAGLPAGITAGLSQLSVLSIDGLESDSFPILVRPRVVSDPDFALRSDPTNQQSTPFIVVSVEPGLGPRQPAVLFLNDPASSASLSLADICRWILPDALRPSDTPSPVTSGLREFLQARGITLAPNTVTRPGSSAGIWVLPDGSSTGFLCIRSTADGLAVYFALTANEVEQGIAFRANGIPAGRYLVRFQVDWLARAENSLVVGKLLFQDSWQPGANPANGAVPPALRQIFTAHSLALSPRATFTASGQGQWIVEQDSMPTSLLLRVSNGQLSVFDTTSPDGEYIGPAVTVL